MSSVDVVVVSYRCRELLRRCLASLDAHAPAAAHVVVVDNDSRDGTAAMVVEQFPRVTLIENRENLGFARATNLGARSGTAPYVLFLNPDTEIRPGTIPKLIELMESRPELGISGCRLERPDGTFDHASRRSFPTAVGAVAHLSGLGRRRQRGPLAQYRAPEVERGPVDAVNGAFMLVRRAALDEVGLFDEGYWMYMEDLDLCYRFKEAGWSTWYEPSVSAIHVKGGTASRSSSPKLTLAFYRGMWRFVRLHPDVAPRMPLRLLVFAGIGGAGAAALLRTFARAAAGRVRHLDTAAA